MSVLPGVVRLHEEVTKTVTTYDLNKGLEHKEFSQAVNNQDYAAGRGLTEFTRTEQSYDHKQGLGAEDYTHSLNQFDTAAKLERSEFTSYENDFDKQLGRSRTELTNVESASDGRKGLSSREYEHDLSESDRHGKLTHQESTDHSVQTDAKNGRGRNEYSHEEASKDALKGLRSESSTESLHEYDRFGKIDHKIFKDIEKDTDAKNGRSHTESTSAESKADATQGLSSSDYEHKLHDTDKHGKLEHTLLERVESDADAKNGRGHFESTVAESKDDRIKGLSSDDYEHRLQDYDKFGKLQHNVAEVVENDQDYRHGKGHEERTYAENKSDMVKGLRSENNEHSLRDFSSHGKIEHNELSTSEVNEDLRLGRGHERSVYELKDADHIRGIGRAESTETERDYDSGKKVSGGRHSDSDDHHSSHATVDTHDWPGMEWHDAESLSGGSFDPSGAFDHGFDAVPFVKERDNDGWRADHSARSAHASAADCDSDCTPIQAPEPVCTPVHAPEAPCEPKAPCAPEPVKAVCTPIQAPEPVCTPIRAPEAPCEPKAPCTPEPVKAVYTPIQAPEPVCTPIRAPEAPCEPKAPCAPQPAAQLEFCKIPTPCNDACDSDGSHVGHSFGGGLKEWTAPFEAPHNFGDLAGSASNANIPDFGDLFGASDWGAKIDFSVQNQFNLELSAAEFGEHLDIPQWQDWA